MAALTSQLQKYSAISAFLMLLVMQCVHTPFQHLVEAVDGSHSCIVHTATPGHVHACGGHSHASSSTCEDDQPSDSSNQEADGSQHSDDCEICHHLSKSVIQVVLVGETTCSEVCEAAALPVVGIYESPTLLSKFARGPPAVA